MDNIEQFGIIIGFISPIVISAINQPGFSEKARVAVMAIVSIIAGLGITYFNGDLFGIDTISAILTVAVASIASYYGIFKPSGASKKIEGATTPKKNQKPVESHTEPTVIKPNGERVVIPDGNGKHRAED